MTRYAPQWLQASSYPASVDRRLIGALWPTAAVTGCAVSVASAMTVNVAPGQVAVPTANNTGSALCSSDAVEQVTLAAAPASGLNRIDLVICQLRGNDVDGGSNNDFLFSAVTGTAVASPTAPAVPANAVALAQILVPGGSAAVTAGNITDRRSGRLAAGQVGVPAGRLYASTQTVLANGATGQIGLQTADYLYGGMSQSGSGLVCPVAGIYRVAVSLAWQVSNGVVPASNNTFVIIVKSGKLGAPVLVVD